MGEKHRSEKKRKRSSESHDRPSKKTPFAPVIDVKFLENSKGPVPVIGKRRLEKMDVPKEALAD